MSVHDHGKTWTCDICSATKFSVTGCFPTEWTTIHFQGFPPFEARIQLVGLPYSAMSRAIEYEVCGNCWPKPAEPELKKNFLLRFKEKIQKLNQVKI